MTPFVADIIWLLFAIGLGWFIFERKKPKEKKSGKSILIISIISWIFFKTLYRAVKMSNGTATDALLVGALFGGIFLLICFGIKWFLFRKKTA